MPDIPFQIELQHIHLVEQTHVFRVSYFTDRDRYLLPYPQVTNLAFRSLTTGEAFVWKTRTVVTEADDFFVLVPNMRISFELQVSHNDDHPRWRMELAPGLVQVQFVAEIDPDMTALQNHARLAQQSRRAALTTIWTGTVNSNTVQFEV